MSLTLAIMIHATAVVIDFSKSLARRRLRLIQARVRSTTQRRGSNTKPLAMSDRLTMSIVQLPSGTSDCSSFSPAQPPSAKTWRSHGKALRIELRSEGTPSRSWISAAWTTAPTSSPLVSVRMCRLRPLIFLPASKPRGPPGGFDRLAIDHPGRRARLAPSHLARLHQQVMVDQFPPSIVPPLVEITLYGRKRRKVLGEHPPLATRFNDVEYRIEHRTHSGLARTANPNLCRQLRLDQCPFFTRRVACIP